MTTRIFCIVHSRNWSCLIVQMVWAERAHKASDQARRAKNWLLGKPGLVLAIVMLVIAVILHRLGYIGS
jgi:hypothetical protein